jgi:O-antigen/teichoic acid export membrane protein
VASSQPNAPAAIGAKLRGLGTKFSVMTGEGRATLLRYARPRTFGNAIVVSTGWILAAQIVRLVAQAAYFVLLARYLGVQQFGALAAALALAAIVGPFAAWGSGNILVMRVSRKPELFRSEWGLALATTFIAGAPLVIGVVVVGVSLLSSLSVQLLMWVALADLMFGRIADISAQAFQARDRPRAMAGILALPLAIRALAAGAFVALGAQPTAASWSKWYCASAFASGAAAAFIVSRTLGWPAHWKWERWRIREGFYFALGLSTSTIYNDIDKTMLARLSSLSATGIYAAAYRAVSLAFTPIMALLLATYPEFFRRGVSGIVESEKFARRMMPAALMYSAAVGCAIALAAPLATVVLGSDYKDTVGALRWLAVAPILQTIYYFGGGVLTGAGFQGSRTAIQVGVAALNIGLCLWLIPAYSWRGAAWATIGCDVALALGFWGIVALLRSRRVQFAS